MPRPPWLSPLAVSRQPSLVWLSFALGLTLSLTAGPQPAPSSKHCLSWVVKGSLLGFHNGYQGPAFSSNVS